LRLVLLLRRSYGQSNQVGASRGPGRQTSLARYNLIVVLVFVTFDGVDFELFRFQRIGRKRKKTTSIDQWVVVMFIFAIFLQLEKGVVRVWFRLQKYFFYKRYKYRIPITKTKVPVQIIHHCTPETLHLGFHKTSETSPAEVVHIYVLAL